MAEARSGTSRAGLSRAGARLALAAALVATFALYSPSLRGGFPFDDQFVAKAEYAPGRPNPMVSELRPVPEYFRSHYWKGWKESGVEYRPVTILSYALTHHAAGARLAKTGFGEAFPQRLLNVLLHLMAALLCYRLLRAAPASRSAAVAGALVFAVHALRSEAVASIVGRGELLAFDFGCAATLVALRAFERTGRALCARGAVAVSLFFLAFASKESAVAWPGILCVLVLVRSLARDPQATHGARAARALRPPLWTASLPLVAFLLLRANALAALPPVAPPDPMVNPLAELSLVGRWLTATRVWGHGLLLTLLPFRLACDYGLAVFPILTSALDPRFLAAAGSLGVALVVGIRTGRRHPLLLLAVAVFYGASFLTTNLPMPIGTIFGERLYYTPALMLSALVAFAVEHPPARALGRGAALAALAAWTLGSSWLVVERARAWRSNETLYLGDLEVQPRSVRLHYLAADFYALRGDRQRQLHHMEQAFLLKPEPTRAWLRLAWFFQRQQRWEEARDALARGLASAMGADARYRFHLLWTRAELLEEIAPDEVNDARAAALAATRELLATPTELEELRERLAENAPAVRIWLVAARALEKRGDLVAAERALREGIAAVRPESEEYRFNLTWNLVPILDAQGKRDAARDVLLSALLADPEEFRRHLDAVRGLRAQGWSEGEIEAILARVPGDAGAS